MKHLTLALAVVVAFGMIACSSSDTASSDKAPQNTEATMADDAGAMADEAGDAMATPVAMEVACAHCVYKMDGVEACAPAVMVDGKPVLITGMDIDAHGLGLCSGPHQAMMAGHMHDGSFEATAFTLE